MALLLRPESGHFNVVHILRFATSLHLARHRIINIARCRPKKVLLGRPIIVQRQVPWDHRYCKVYFFVEGRDLPHTL